MPSEKIRRHLPLIKTLIYCVPKKGRLTKINALYFLQVTGLFFFARF
ncbi:hypothetical protein [Neisseria gonorrhoeae]|nr:hypothetical protein [Neisseria gonorrhoeae]